MKYTVYWFHGKRSFNVLDFTYRFGAFSPIPNGKIGRRRAALPSVLATESALGSCRHVALSSARFHSILWNELRLNKTPTLHYPAFLSS